MVTAAIDDSSATSSLIQIEYFSFLNQFDRKHKDWTAFLWMNVIWSDESTFTLFQNKRQEKGKKRSGWNDYPLCLVHPVEVGQIQSVRSKFSNVMCPNRCFQLDQSTFSSLTHILSRECQDSKNTKKKKEVVQGAWDTTFPHGLATTESRHELLWKSLECAVEGFTLWTSIPISKKCIQCGEY